MFKLRATNTFDWEVTAEVPQDGDHMDVTFQATFNILPTSEVNKAAKNEKPIVEILRDALVSFSGLPVEDADGNEVTDNATKNAIILDNPVFSAALLRAYREGVNGHREKN